MVWVMAELPGVTWGAGRSTGSSFWIFQDFGSANVQRVTGGCKMDVTHGNWGAETAETPSLQKQQRYNLYDLEWSGSFVEMSFCLHDVRWAGSASRNSASASIAIE